MASTEVSRVMFELDRHVREYMVRLAVNILGALTALPTQGGTPRDTGWAASNWITVTGERGTPVIGDKKAVTFGPQMAAKNSLIRYRLIDGPISIVNNAPHIGLLNAGSSKQAPANFIQVAIAKATAASKGLLR